MCFATMLPRLHISLLVPLVTLPCLSPFQWMCCAIIILLIVALIIVLAVVQ